jgi:hypothetical protein
MGFWLLLLSGIVRLEQVAEELCLDDFDDFTALVLAALGAGAVGANFFVTVRAVNQLGDGEGIVSAAGRGTSLRMAAFWIGHFVPTF